MSYVKTALKDADVLLFMTDGKEKTTNHEATLETISKMDHIPVLLLINKIDLHDQAHVMERISLLARESPSCRGYSCQRVAQIQS